jgi:anti-sigma factor RsiW
MDCDRARQLILDRAPAAGDAAALEEHLAGCAACRRARDVERVTDELLARRPVHRLPPAALARLRQKVAGGTPGAEQVAGGTPGAEQVAGGTPGAEQVAGGTPGAERTVRRRVSPLVWLAAAALAVVLVLGFLRNRRDEHARVEARLTDEVVNDHLRILYSEHPLDIASGGIHQVKPWFAGKLDFAPMKIFEGDEQLPLQGGAVAVVLDRKAAAFVYKRRLHQVTLLVTRAEGLPWPTPNNDVGRLHVHVETVRGFSTVTWVEGELGYALVSDIDRNELAGIAPRITVP